MPLIPNSRLVLLFVFGVMVLGAKAGAAPWPISLVPDAPTAAGEELSLEEALRGDGLWTALEGVLRTLGAPANDTVSAPHFTPARVHVPHERSYRTEGGIVLRVDTTNGRIRSYRDEGRLALQGRGQSAINRDAALDIANALLARLGVGAQFDRSHLSSDANLSGQWRFHLPTGYEGVPCGGGFRVWINGEGRVVLYRDGPSCVPPPSMEQSIRKRKAASIAKSFVRDRYGKRDVRMGRRDLALRIVHPNNVWQDRSQAGYAESQASRLAWVVAFPDLRVASVGIPVTLFVDAESGQVIGGIR